MSTSLTFDDSAAEFILESFGAKIDDEGYVVDAGTGNRLTTPEGEDIKAKEFGGVEDGSVVFLDDNFVSLVEHVKRRQSE